MHPIILIPCHLSPRVANLADYVAGLLAIRAHGIPQTLHLHPQDIAIISPLL
jgi:hypothetical protein